MSRRPKSHGNIQDLERLLAELDRPPIIELGKPAPDEKFLPGRRPVSCPAELNRRLLGDLDD
jgi:hypothetical protein